MLRGGLLRRGEAFFARAPENGGHQEDGDRESDRGQNGTGGGGVFGELAEKKLHEPEGGGEGGDEGEGEKEVFAREVTLRAVGKGEEDGDADGDLQEGGYQRDASAEAAEPEAVAFARVGTEKERASDAADGKRGKEEVDGVREDGAACEEGVDFFASEGGAVGVRLGCVLGDDGEERREVIEEVGTGGDGDEGAPVSAADGGAGVAFGLTRGPAPIADAESEGEENFEESEEDAATEATEKEVAVGVVPEEEEKSAAEEGAEENSEDREAAELGGEVGRAAAIGAGEAFGRASD